MELTWMTDEDFRKAARVAAADGKRVENVGVRKSASFTRAAADKPIQLVISTDTVDRYDDTLALDGWDLKAFEANPVCLWMHSRWDMPIARATKVWLEKNALMAELEFAGADINPMAPAIEAAIRKGFLNAASVGFRPVEYGPRKDSEGYGLAFLKQELLEISVVTIPANPDATVTQRGLGGERASVSASTADRLEDCVKALNECTKAMGDHCKAHGENNETLAGHCKALEAAIAKLTPEEPAEDEPEVDDEEDKAWGAALAVLKKS